MNHYIITITRQFGSLGRPIAKELAKKLDIPYYDRSIVEQASSNLNLPVSTIADIEEKSHSLFSSMKEPLGTNITAVQNKIFEAQKEPQTI